MSINNGASFAVLNPIDFQQYTTVTQLDFATMIPIQAAQPMQNGQTENILIKLEDSEEIMYEVLTPISVENNVTNQNTLLNTYNQLTSNLRNNDFDQNEGVQYCSAPETIQKFKFDISREDYKALLGCSKPIRTKYRCFYGQFGKIFEKYMEQIEKSNVEFDERYGICNEDSENNKYHIRIDVDCKLCKKENCVKYEFIIERRPFDSDEYVSVLCQIKGLHDQHLMMDTSFETETINESMQKKRARKNTISAIATNSPPPRSTPTLIATPKSSFTTTTTTTTTSTATANNNENENGANVEQILEQISCRVLNQIGSYLDKILIKIEETDKRLINLEQKFDSIQIYEIN